MHLYTLYIIPGPVDSTEVSALSQRAKDERWSVYTFRDGLQTLPDTLLTNIKERGVTVKMEQPCTQLVFKDGKAMVSDQPSEITVLVVCYCH